MKGFREVAENGARRLREGEGKKRAWPRRLRRAAYGAGR